MKGPSPGARRTVRYWHDDDVPEPTSPIPQHCPSPRELDDLVPISTKVREVLERAGTRLALSPRAFHRVIKVARTIADLDEHPDINESHVLEALQYREKKA